MRGTDGQTLTARFRFRPPSLLTFICKRPSSLRLFLPHCRQDGTPAPPARAPHAPHAPPDAHRIEIAHATAAAATAHRRLRVCIVLGPPRTATMLSTAAMNQFCRAMLDRLTLDSGPAPTSRGNGLVLSSEMLSLADTHSVPYSQSRKGRKFRKLGYNTMVTLSYGDFDVVSLPPGSLEFVKTLQTIVQDRGEMIDGGISQGAPRAVRDMSWLVWGE